MIVDLMTKKDTVSLRNFFSTAEKWTPLPPSPLFDNSCISILNMKIQFRWFRLSSWRKYETNENPFMQFDSKDWKTTEHSNRTRFLVEVAKNLFNVFVLISFRLRWTKIDVGMYPNIIPPSFKDFCVFVYHLYPFNCLLHIHFNCYAVLELRII